MGDMYGPGSGSNDGPNMGFRPTDYEAYAASQGFGFAPVAGQGQPDRSFAYPNTPPRSSFGATDPSNSPPYLPQARLTLPPVESNHKFLGFAVGFTGICAEHIFSHPCVVLRRQCQVHHNSNWSHLTPFTLVQVVFNIHRRQSITTLFKGIGSTFMVKGIGAVSETAISEITPLPREVNRHSSLKKLFQHLALKGLAVVITTPFYAASLVETVQSEIASERPGVFDCFREGGMRLVTWFSPQTTRLLPVWKLMLPHLFYSMSHYIVSSIARYTMLLSLSQDSVKDEEPEQVDTFYNELQATFVGCLLADLVTYPLETVLNRLALQGTRTIIDNTDSGIGVIPIITRYEGFWDCSGSIIQSEGLGGFYKGFGALLLQYGIHIGILKLTKLVMDILVDRRPPQILPATVPTGVAPAAQPHPAGPAAPHQPSLSSSPMPSYRQADFTKPPYF